MEKLYPITVEVNGKQRAAQVPARLSLVDWLRDELRLTGTHVGCEHGICGACSIMLDGDPVRSCLMFAVQADGHRVTTVEGLLQADGKLSVLQDSFCEAHGLQCGYCTPGMIMSALDIVRRNGNDLDEHTIREQLDGNICRCTGYHNIVKAIAAGAKNMPKVGAQQAAE